MTAKAAMQKIYFVFILHIRKVNCIETSLEVFTYEK